MSDPDPFPIDDAEFAAESVVGIVLHHHGTDLSAFNPVYIRCSGGETAADLLDVAIDHSPIEDEDADVGHELLGPLYGDEVPDEEAITDL